MDGAPQNDMPGGSRERAGEGGPVRAVIRRLDALTERESLELRHILDAFGETAFLPVLIVLAMIVVSPLSGIPLLPTVFGTMIALVSLQLLLGKPRIWLPAMLSRRRISGARLHGALRRLQRIADWLDRTARDRMRLLVSPPLDALPKGACVLAGASMPLLELVPFSSSILAGAVALFATGLLTRDGLFALLAAALMGLAALIPLALYGNVIRAALAA
jgi:hypothetical protein